MAYGEAALEYMEQGWAAPFPLPIGLKYPPPEEVTGNHLDADEGSIERWLEIRPDDNVGLRMPRVRFEGDDQEYEVIGIDVDQYGTKRGWDTLLHLAETLGPLPATWKSSRHSADNPSGIYFFLVPGGKKWKGKAGADIDIIQRTHRYAVVAPSEYEGTFYRWHTVPETTDGIVAVPVDAPPDVADLPDLPDTWQDHLLKGRNTAGVRTAKVAMESIHDAYEWMKHNFPGWDKEPSSEMARASRMEDLESDAAGGAHDMIVNRIHRVVQLGVEGHHGLKGALQRIQMAFQSEVLGENDPDAARRDIGTMQAEFNRALFGEILKLRQDIAAGLAMVDPIGGLSADDVNIDTSAVIKALRHRRALPDATDYDPNDLGRAEMVLAHFGDELRPISETKDRWGFWNPARRRYERLPHEQLVAEVWKPTVIGAYKVAMGAAFDEADIMTESGDIEGAKGKAKTAMEFKRLAESAGSLQHIRNGMQLAHSMSDHRISEAVFDANPHTLGVANGVLDFSQHQDDPAAYLREGKSDDLIFANTEVEYVPGAQDPLWKSTLETFLPDPKYRRFVQRVFGYALLGGNEERLAIFLQGATSTGKSTFMDAIRSALGKSYADTVAANALFREKQDAGPNPELVSASSKRVVFSSEVGTHYRLHADVIKRLTGGTDEISARNLYSNDVVTRAPMFTPIIATNAMPTIINGDAALWRRLLVLPFDRQVPKGTLRTARISSSMSARQAVLAWLVDGLSDYLAHGLNPEDWPEIVKKRGEQFVEGTSPFQSFLARCATRTGDTKDRVEASRLYSIYQTWCAQEAIRQNDVFTRTEFARQMENNDLPRRVTSRRVEGKKNPEKIRVFVGLKLTGSLA